MCLWPSDILLFFVFVTYIDIVERIGSGGVKNQDIM